MILRKGILRKDCNKIIIVCYKMFPYIVTFQNKLKGVTVQYILSLLLGLVLSFRDLKAFSKTS
ncbi:hypothetical protein V1477_009685 [Vespula maculifrons]|uniref:Uncharacterized protein n=1 Tax=Vespula maculifrons TaxID=7453 RepID=A0ABD2CAG7_VESMC